MSNISRRKFFKLGGAATASTVATAASVTSPVTYAKDLTESGTNAVLKYEESSIIKAKDLKVNEPKPFFYPDKQSMCQMIKMGHPVPGGVGPDQDIVAYSILCPHMGCPTSYDKASRTFQCGCHFSKFDAEKEGQQIIGQATQNMPRIELAYNVKNGEVYAIGVHGLIYGRQANTL